MIEKKEPKIKLFGKMIQVCSNSSSRIEHSNSGECTSSDHYFPCSEQSENRGDEKSSARVAIDTKQEEEPSSSLVLEESKRPTSLSTVTENDQASSTNSQEQSPQRRPDKILPCPRCSSMDTKFCYFNNYNVNQPRHFCKNCQRYWTAGGTMRNVPVGAGRRKNKSSSASHHCHVMIPNAQNGLTHHAVKSSCDSSLYESMSSMLSFVEKSPVHISNGKENVNFSSVFDSHSIGKERNEGMRTCENIPSQMACFPISSWPYNWNQIGVQSGYQMSYYTTPPHRACNTSGTWNPQGILNPSVYSDESSLTSRPKSPSLGKHPRQGSTLKPSGTCRNDPTKPKVLRIDDPIAVAKSSMWYGVRSKNDAICSPNGGRRINSRFKHIDHCMIKASARDSSMILQANPAAFCRSSSLHEVTHQGY